MADTATTTTAPVEPGKYIISIDGVRHHYTDGHQARSDAVRLYGRGRHVIYLGRRR